jgi:DHA1 family tetracycline resistance protein-like MFS transporter
VDAGGGRWTLPITEAPSPLGPHRAALAFIFVTVVLDMLALGMIVPVLPKLVEVFLGGNTARAAQVYGVFVTVWALMQFLFSPLLGALSDRFGRRPVILLSNFGLGFDYIVMALAPNLGWLFVGRVISGITSATFATASAYIADVTPPEKRAAGYGMLSVAFGFGFVLGPAAGGLLGTVGPRLPFWVAAGLSLANAMYGLFVLPESLPVERRAGFDWRSANPVGALTLLRSHPQLLGLGVVSFMSNIAHEALPTTFVLYASHRYGWDHRAVGLSIAAIGVSSAIVGGGLVQPVVARFGERRVLLAGMSFGTVGFIIYGMASTGRAFLTAIPVNAVWGLAWPAMQGLMTRHVAASEQGQLQGGLGALRGIAFMIGPVLFTATFAAFISPQHGWNVPGAPFLLAAFLVAAATVVAWRATRSRTELERR